MPHSASRLNGLAPEPEVKARVPRAGRHGSAPSRLFTDTSPGLAEAVQEAREQVRDRGLEPIAETYRRIMNIEPAPTGK